MGVSPACRRVAWEAKAFVWSVCAGSVRKHRTGLAGLCSLKFDKRVWRGRGGWRHGGGVDGWRDGVGGGALLLCFMGFQNTS